MISTSRQRDAQAVGILDAVAVPGTPLLSVVVPTRNEADNVRVLFSRLQAALDGVPFELCVVDDSDDSTPEVLAELAESHSVRPRHRVKGERAGGLSTAVVEGLRMARGNYVCVMDADLQHPPELIPALLAEAEEGADLVVASRYIPGGSREGLSGGVRQLVSRAATMLARLLFTEARLSADPLSGFFLCRRVLIEGIEMRPVGFKILLELLVCVPGLRVRDVPLRFASRESGESKASMKQGLLFVSHCWSLFKYAAGSARYWKFGIVGISGVGVFLPTLWFFATQQPRWSPLVSFVPAFLLSFAWNGIINWGWTFADHRHQAETAARQYFTGALLAGAAMFGIYAGLIELHLHVLVAGIIAALAGMALNGLMNRASVRRHVPGWGRIAEDRGVQAVLTRLATELSADRAYLLEPEDERSVGLPAELVTQVMELRRPTLVTEAPSHRPQRRSNIEWMSRLFVPVVDGNGVAAVVVCERRSVRGFDDASLSSAVRAVDRLARIITEDQRKL